ncbi:MAG: DUF72 domain-containing protein [Planctomycetota bacterium]
MKIHVGTSGYDYKEWKGVFYPPSMKQEQFLEFYGRQFSTVEINNTFYRNPNSKKIESWFAAVPDHFAFSIKATRRISHNSQLDLATAADPLQFLLKAVDGLTTKFGCLLFQMPPHFKKDLAVLSAFLPALERRRAAFEFRDKSWFDEEVYAVLRKHNATLCIADAAKGPVLPVIPEFTWGYLRLRREDYDGAALDTWAATIAAQPWHSAFVFFKHEVEGAAPRLAGELIKRLPPA